MSLRVAPPTQEDIGRDYGKSLNRWCRVTSGPTARNSTVAVGAKDEKLGRSKDKSISILLIEDNRLFRIGLSSLLRKQKGLKLLASSARPDVIPQLGPWRRPDVILLDLGLGDRGSIQVVRGIREASPDARLIAMGLIPVKSEILGLVKEGVSGFILKDASKGPSGRQRCEDEHPGTGDRRSDHRGHEQQGNREEAQHRHGHREEPCPQHPGKALIAQPRASRRPRTGSGVDRSLTLPRAWLRPVARFTPAPESAVSRCCSAGAFVIGTPPKHPPSGLVPFPSVRGIGFVFPDH